MESMTIFGGIFWDLNYGSKEIIFYVNSGNASWCLDCECTMCSGLCMRTCRTFFCIFHK